MDVSQNKKKAKKLSIAKRKSKTGNNNNKTKYKRARGVEFSRKKKIKFNGTIQYNVTDSFL